MSGGEPVRVRVLRLPEAGDLPLPEKATAASAGFDMRACVAEAIVVAPGERVLVPTGFAIALPEGYEAQVRPRSGLALETGLTLLNTPGTVDADYRGEIRIIVVNHGASPVEIRRGDRVAQLVVQRVPEVVLESVSELPGSARGDRGFGHTGTR